MIILDTNVLSELMRPKPSPRVVAWVARQPATELFTTSITEAEVFYGIELLTKGKRRERLLAAAEAMFAEDFRAVSLGSRAIQRDCFLRLPPSPWARQTYQPRRCADRGYCLSARSQARDAQCYRLRGLWS
jgi:hypothetical protein